MLLTPDDGFPTLDDMSWYQAAGMRRIVLRLDAVTGSGVAAVRRLEPFLEQAKRLDP